MVVKANADVTPRGVVYTLRSVHEDRVSSWHTLRVYYILLRGCLLCLFISKAVVGLDRQTGRC